MKKILWARIEDVGRPPFLKKLLQYIHYTGGDP
jgi:hypothetical protein